MVAENSDAPRSKKCDECLDWAPYDGHCGQYVCATCGAHVDIDHCDVCGWDVSVLDDDVWLDGEEVSDE